MPAATGSSHDGSGKLFSLRASTEDVVNELLLNASPLVQPGFALTVAHVAQCPAALVGLLIFPGLRLALPEKFLERICQFLPADQCALDLPRDGVDLASRERLPQFLFQLLARARHVFRESVDAPLNFCNPDENLLERKFFLSLEALLHTQQRVQWEFKSHRGSAFFSWRLRSRLARLSCRNRHHLLDRLIHARDNRRMLLQENLERGLHPDSHI